MSIILNIDTAQDIASVCLAKDDTILQTAFSENQKDHASWLHPVINELLQKNNLTIQQLTAVAASTGPGSYTGLRVGLSAAKGFCFALKIPLITAGSLNMLAYAVKAQADDLIVPAIDARRMEIFTAVYDKNLEEKIPAHALVVNEISFSEILKSHSILFCGNGTVKLKNVLKNVNCSFSETRADAATLAMISHKLYLQKQFADLAYTEPLYVKEFFSPASRN